MESYSVYSFVSGFVFFDIIMWMNGFPHPFKRFYVFVRESRSRENNRQGQKQALHWARSPCRTWSQESWEQMLNWLNHRGILLFFSLHTTLIFWWVLGRRICVWLPPWPLCFLLIFHCLPLVMPRAFIVFSVSPFPLIVHNGIIEAYFRLSVIFHFLTWKRCYRYSNRPLSFDTCCLPFCNSLLAE